MFDLEKSIAKWRKQMLAEGIKSPLPLEELELHLREEIEHQMKSGVDAQLAFETAVSRIGSSKELRTEIAKENGLSNLLFGGDEFTRTNRIFAMFWLPICLWHVAGSSLLISASFSCRDDISVLIYGLAIFIYGAGAIGSALLFGGRNPGRNVIRFIAWFGIIAFFIGGTGYDWWPSTWANSPLFLVFNFLTIWFLGARKHRKLVITTI